ncbi:uncharacterized protein LOC135201324 [Macrobrachium nipponense]|uniref:uncharacterized protein LOC135201324 n=1 Tax=Macrobrachium nipponense TaxID=159736 RepID=UPI0030C7EF7C
MRKTYGSKTQPSSQMYSALLATVLALSLVAQGRSETGPPGGGYYYGPAVPHFNNHYVKNAAAVRDPSLQKIYELIYPYYQRPKYRYPFYDHEGNGELLYGYGGRKLYRYTVFKPVEGYLRR